MKKLLLLISIVSFFVGIMSLTIFKLSEKVGHKQVENDISQPVFTKEKFRYQYERLRDPNTGKIPDNIRSKELNFIKNTFNLSSSKVGNKFLSSSEWTNRGPFEIGGRTRAFDLDIRNENILIAGGISSGMWKSTNGGADWTRTSKPYQLQSVSCLAQDRRPGKENNWYYGTGEYWGNSADISGDGIYKSTNNGDSWDVLPSTLSKQINSWDNPFDYIWNIAVDNTAPLNKDVVYVATTSYGIYRTTDGGNMWAAVLGGGDGATFSDITISPKGVIYATLSSNGKNNKGIYRSTDGINWTNITPANFPKDYNRTVIGIAPSDENQVYIVSETPGAGKETTDSQGNRLFHSLWKYTYISGNGGGDGGVWENRSENLPKPEATRGQMNSQRGYNLVIKVKPDNPDVVFIGAVAVYRSNSGFKNYDYAWIGGTCPDESCDYDYRYTNHHSDVHALFFSPNNPNIFYTGSDGGIHKTLDAMSNKVEWISLNNGYFTTQFYTVALSHGSHNSTEVIGGLQDNGTLLTRNEKLDERWTNPLKADGFYCAISNDNRFYYASQNATWQPHIKIYRVEQDKNGNNIKQTRIDPAGGKDFIWNTPFLLDPNNDNIMYVAGGKMVWRNNDLSLIPNETKHDSTNIGWDSLSKTRIDYKEDVSPIGEVITALGISTKPANVLYYGTNVGNVFRIDNANQGNPTPINIKGQSFPGGAYVSSIAVNPDDAMKVVVSFSNYGVISIYYSDNGGNSWTSISGNLEENPNGTGSGPAVNWIEILKYNDKYVYFAGTSTGLFSTTFINGANTAWQLEGKDQIGNMVIDMIDARHSDKYVAVGTHGIGVFTGYYTNNTTPPEITSLVSPADGSKNILPDINFQWETVADAVFYEVQLSTDPNFNDNVIILDGIREGKANYNDITQGKLKYYWRVRTVNAGGASQFTQAWSFTSAIAPPELIFPSNNQTQIPTTTTLKWQAVDGANKYRLQYKRSFNIDNPSIDTILTTNEFSMSNLEAGKSHVWRVASLENDFEGIFSPTYRFTTEKVNSVEDEQSVNNFEAKLYPNPITINSKLAVEVLSSDLIDIKVYDYTGALISILNNSFLNQGTYNFSLPYKHLNSGVYNIVIYNGKIKQIIKFINKK
ncbi:MAG TPA: T9SS type A sorting domain-containing protein [Candidatus Kapabacteria bacterium]|nr:T9SS type A sorting domain-containing protein [Candidatus Kapabacteria bacterium]